MTTDLWQYLAKTDRPIVLYGTGDGADKILSFMEQNGRTASGVFASDGFVRSRTFRGMKVMSYSDALQTFGQDMIILIAFGSSLPPVLERFFELDKMHEVYAPEVPVAGGEVFTSEIYDNNIELIKKARKLLSDDMSRELYDEMMAYRLDGRLSHLSACLSSEESVFSELLHCEDYRITLDLGAYNGDTALSLISRSQGLETIIALEPDEKNFAKLVANTSDSGKVEAHRLAAWSKSESFVVRRGGGRGVKRGELLLGDQKTAAVYAAPPDSLLKGRKIDFIKFDVEGAESEALLGCKKAITEHSPELQIALYHKSEDIFRLPLQLNDFGVEYNYYLRRFPYVPAWDLNLFAVPKARK